MSARSLSGLGFNGSPAFPRGGLGAAESPSSRKAGATRAAAPFKLVYEIAPYRIPVRDHMHGLGFMYGGDGDMDMGGGGSDGGYDGYFTNGGGGGWDGWGPTFTGNSGIYIGGGPGPITNNSGGGSGGGYPPPPSGRSGSGTGSSTPTFRPPSTSRNPADIVNAIEPLLKQNLINFKTGDRSAASKQAALNYFDAAWSYVSSSCGTACTTDRQAGACKWRRGSGDPMEQYDGIHAGECWNWWAYRDPIARDTGVATSIFGGTTTAGQIIPGVNLGSSSGILLIGAAVIFLLVAVGGKH